MVGTPEPPPPYRTRRVYPHLAFEQPTAFVQSPAGDRWFVTEMQGKVFSFPNDPNCREPELVIDVKDLVAPLGRRKGEELAVGALYGIVPDPDFASNRHIYLCYSACYEDWKRSPPPADGTRVVRLTASREDPPRCDPDTEVELLTWQGGGHHCGCLVFGPDGCLYVSTGDGGFHEPADGLRTGQDVTDLLASILRIDVRNSDTGRPYKVPPDNPLLDVPDARGEIFAFGLRNPWKMSFDRQTGALWVGDVGLERTEWIRRVRAGDNCGWSIVDGRESLHPDWPRGPGEIVPPVLEIPHTDAASITGGFVYRGRRFPELVGSYVFGDWETRRLWSVNVESDDPGPRRDLADPVVRVVAFAEDRDGELFLLDHGDGTIHELVRNEAAAATAAFPTRLSQTGLFRDTPDHEPAAGVVPFDVATAAWADHATARRLIAVPGNAPVTMFATPQPVEGSMFKRQLAFPAGTVLAKTLELETKRGDPTSSRRIETQVLHYDGLAWRGYTYAWNDDQTDAELVAAAGAERELTIADAEIPGGVRRQTWRFQSRSECLRCHNPWAETTLAFNVAQLDRDIRCGGSSGSQLAALRAQGVLVDGAIDAQAAAVESTEPGGDRPSPKLTVGDDPSAPLADRARSYLHVNCGHCHRFGGGGMAAIRLDLAATSAETRAIDVAPSQGDFGVGAARVVAAGDPGRSTLLYRMATDGAGHMPPIGTSLVDHRGVALMYDWIRQIPPAAESAPPPTAPADVARLAATRDAAEQQTLIGRLLAATSGVIPLAHAVRAGSLPESTRLAVLAAASEHPDATVAAIFSPFLAADRGPRRLGTSVDAATILALSGDAARGRMLFHESSLVQCRSCHVVAGTGRAIGPDLTDVGRRLDRTRLLESMLEPSRVVAPEYRSWIVQTGDGRILTGIVVHRDAAGLVIRRGDGVDETVPAGQVEEAVPQATSAMPEHTLRDLTASQAADLLAYLEACRNAAP